MVAAVFFRTSCSVIMLHAKGWDYFAMYLSKLYVLYLPFVMDRPTVYRGVTIMYNVRNCFRHFGYQSIWYLLLYVLRLQLFKFGHTQGGCQTSVSVPQRALIKTKKKILLFEYCYFLSSCLFLLLW
jgi:hypothetical protein